MLKTLRSFNKKLETLLKEAFSKSGNFDYRRMHAQLSLLNGLC